jgi:hypothetical protein
MPEDQVVPPVRRAVPGPKAAALATLAGVLTFLPSLAAGFVYDDVLLIQQNPYVQSVHGIAGAFSRHFWETYELGSRGIGLVYYRPLVTLSFVLNWLAGGGGAWTFHLVNVLLHGLAVFLATRIALRWLKQRWLAALVGILFAVHPTRSESVIWIAGRTDLLMAIFVLLALELVHAARRSSPSWRMLVLGLLAFVASLFCKEGAVVLPVLLLADALADEPERLSKTSYRVLGGAVAVAATYVGLRLWLLPVRSSGSAFLPEYGFMTVATYAGRLLWPWPQTFFYRNLMSNDGVHPIYPWPWVLLGVVVVVAYAAGTWLAFRRDRAAGVCLIAAVTFLAPVLNFIETGIFVTVSDHFLYLPLFLLALGTARAMGPSLAGLSPRALGLTALAVVIISSVANVARARDYANSAALWQRELELDAFNPVALEWQSRELSNQGRLAGAATLLERALHGEAQRHFLLARKEAASGRYVRLFEIYAALTPDGDRPKLEQIYAELLGFWHGERTLQQGRLGAIQLGGDYGQAPTARRMNARGRAALAAELGVLASRLGRLKEARAWLERVPDAELSFVPNPLTLVLARARTQDFKGAEQSLAVLQGAQHPALQSDPNVTQRLRARLTRARDAVQAGKERSGSERAALQAFAELELGGYLSACRRLRRAYEADPSQQNVAQLYAQALVSARRDAEAEAVIARALGPEQARRAVRTLQQSLDPVLRDAAPVPPNVPWYP